MTAPSWDRMSSLIQDAIDVLDDDTDEAREALEEVLRDIEAARAHAPDVILAGEVAKVRRSLRTIMRLVPRVVEGLRTGGGA